MDRSDNLIQTDFTQTHHTLEQGSGFGRIVRFLVIGVIIAVFLILTLTLSPKNQDLTNIRDSRTIIGDQSAKNHYVMLTDVMCPYCDVFSRLAMENEEKFKKYLKDHDIVFEIRMTDYLHEQGMDSLGFSKMGAEAIACATEQNRFWDYYHQVIRRLWRDYHSKGIGSSKTAPKITDITNDYWLSIAKEVKLDDSFKDCFLEHQMQNTVKRNTLDAITYMARYGLGGMPSFRFNQRPLSGFDNNWGYDYVERYLEAGLK